MSDSRSRSRGAFAPEALSAEALAQADCATSSRSPKARGAERRETQGLRGPWAAGEAAPARLRVRRPVAIRGARLSALHLRLFSGPGPRFLRWHSRHGQPAPGGGAVVRPRWSPGSPGLPLTRRGGQEPRERCVAPSAPGSHGLISGHAFRPAPSSERHRLTPLSERGGEEYGPRLRRKYGGPLAADPKPKGVPRKLAKAEVISVPRPDARTLQISATRRLE
jgi:hypothetical protein